MTPELQQLLAQWNKLNFSDRYMFAKHIAIQDGHNIVIGTTKGTQFGTNSASKIGFLGATPVARQAAISAPSGGAVIDVQARTAIAALISLEQTFGFTS